MLAVTCLGRLPGKLPAPLRARIRRTLRAHDAATAKGFVGASLSQALVPSSAAAAAVGWQIGSSLVRVGAQTFLARGASVEVGSAPAVAARGGLSAGLVRAGTIMAKQRIVTTRLPASVQVVILELDAIDLAAAADGDLAISAEGGELVTPPTVVVAGTRRTLFYDVRPQTGAAAAPALKVSVASRGGFTVAGVVGVSGRAAEWAARLADAQAPELVGPQALTADGAVTIHLFRSESPS
jgi:hypothetical protein